MDWMLRQVFIRDIEEQCAFALGSAQGINEGLRDTSRTQDQVWFSIRSLLTAAANISKCLWPAPRRETAAQFADRGKVLRDLLAVEEDSPLANRDLRNHFEHMDERLESWWLTDPSHNIARRIIGPFDRTIVGLPAESMFEQFDPVTACVAFRGDVFELQLLVDEISRLKRRASDFLAQPAPPPDER